MKLLLGTLLFFLGFAHFSWGQTNGSTNLVSSASSAHTSSPNAYAVFGASPQQETLIRAQIQIMQPAVLPLRVFFVPHWKYIDTARIFRLHVPTGYTSSMFTHLPSRTTFIDSDRYMGEEWLGHWMAHELGHLASNSTKEDDAEKAARNIGIALKMHLRGTRSEVFSLHCSGLELNEGHDFRSRVKPLPVRRGCLRDSEPAPVRYDTCVQQGLSPGNWKPTKC